MQCRDIMKSDVKCASPGTTVTEAAACMRDEQIGFLPVCDASGSVVGTLTDRDITVRVVADNHSPSEPVEHFMTRDVVVCLSVDDLSAARDLMIELQVSRIICVNEEGRLEGIISLSDIDQEACRG